MLISIGFVPLIDEIAMETNIYPAYIYGLMWINRNSYNQFDHPLDKLPERVNASRSTVRKWVKWLCDNQYIQDLTPDRKNQHHVYQLTDKIVLETRVTVEIARSNSRTAAVRQKNGAPSARNTASQAAAVRQKDGLMNHDVMMHEDSKLDGISELWAQLGLDIGSLRHMVTIWEADIEVGAVECLGRCLTMWLAALEAGQIPEKWGLGLIYQKIADGEAPPTAAKKLTFGDEARAAMLLHQQQNQEQEDQ